MFDASKMTLLGFRIEISWNKNGSEVLFETPILKSKQYKAPISAQHALDIAPVRTGARKTRELPSSHLQRRFSIAYAAVAYLESRHDDESSAFTLIMSRSRQAPLVKRTSPIIELLAAPIAVRLKRFHCERMEIEFAQVRFYTDSMITYYWVTSKKPGSFNRVVSCDGQAEHLGPGNQISHRR